MIDDHKRILVTNNMVSYAEPIGDLGVVNACHQYFKSNPNHFKLVLFTGGEDVSPSLYKDTSPKGLCHYSPERDAEEAHIFRIARNNGIKMVGVCRGAQFLTVMTGGKLMHHVSKHAGGYHDMVCSMDTSTIIRVNSLHHQMCLPAKGNYIVGWTPKRISTEYFGIADKPVKYCGPEVEAIVFPEIKAFAVQYHPEMMTPGSEGWRYFHNAVEDLLKMSTKDFADKYRGIKNVLSEPTKPATDVKQLTYTPTI